MAVENMAAAKGVSSAVAEERSSEVAMKIAESMYTARARCHSSVVRSLWRFRVRNAAAISLAGVALSFAGQLGHA